MWNYFWYCKQTTLKYTNYLQCRIMALMLIVPRYTTQIILNISYGTLLGLPNDKYFLLSLSFIFRLRRDYLELLLLSFPCFVSIYFMHDWETPNKLCCTQSKCFCDILLILDLIKVAHWMRCISVYALLMCIPASLFVWNILPTFKGKNYLGTHDRQNV